MSSHSGHPTRGCIPRGFGLKAHFSPARTKSGILVAGGIISVESQFGKTHPPVVITALQPPSKRSPTNHVSGPFNRLFAIFALHHPAPPRNRAPTTSTATLENWEGRAVRPRRWAPARKRACLAVRLCSRAIPWTAAYRTQSLPIPPCPLFAGKRAAPESCPEIRKPLDVYGGAIWGCRTAPCPATRSRPRW